MLADEPYHQLGETLETRIHLCGRLVARIAGERVETALPGRQGRLLFAYLVLERARPATREELTEALWQDEEPAAADSALSALLSKLRRVVPIARGGSGWHWQTVRGSTSRPPARRSTARRRRSRGRTGSMPGARVA